MRGLGGTNLGEMDEPNGGGKPNAAGGVVGKGGVSRLRIVRRRDPGRVVQGGATHDLAETLSNVSLRFC